MSSSDSLRDGGATDETAAERLRTVLVVDDSELMRALLSDIIVSTGRYRVVGEAETGFQAIRLVHELNPDVVTLDLEMPDLRGADALRYIMAEAPRPVIVVSGHSEALADPILHAVEVGALELVAKPHGDEPREVEVLQHRLLAALEAAADASIANLHLGRRMRARSRARRHEVRLARQSGADLGRPARGVVAIASSTGGPRALVELVPMLPSELEHAVLIAQHMPSTFTRLLAQRLDEIGPLPVTEAVHGQTVEAGRVYLAPGGYHMGVARTAAGFAIELSDGAPIWGVRPAADLLFHAVARNFGPRAVGVVLTGMGRDGAAGMRAIREVGGWTAVQDASTAVMPSMPRAAAPYANAELPLDRLARAVADRCRIGGGAQSLP